MDQDLEYEVLKLIVALRHYQETKRGLYFLEQAIDKVLAMIADRPGMLEVMSQLGIVTHLNHNR